MAIPRPLMSRCSMLQPPPGSVMAKQQIYGSSPQSFGANSSSIALFPANVAGRKDHAATPVAIMKAASPRANSSPCKQTVTIGSTPSPPYSSGMFVFWEPSNTNFFCNPVMSSKPWRASGSICRRMGMISISTKSRTAFAIMRASSGTNALMNLCSFFSIVVGSVMSPPP